MGQELTLAVHLRQLVRSQTMHHTHPNTQASTHIHARTHIRTGSHTHKHSHVRTHTQMNTHTRTNALTHSHTHTHIHTSMRRNLPWLSKPLIQSMRRRNSLFQKAKRSNSPAYKSQYKHTRYTCMVQMYHACICTYLGTCMCTFVCTMYHGRSIKNY